ncbi:heavy-metal-associated domain-containing protein [Heyndrickxia faecalis]|uniref:heavy-metal-associated domain-containing protein n=1 Tax=Heyndrickxia TaxID=2837504 RepID=UPI000421CF4D|nr:MULTISPECIES: heavy-metal-associated domain-containing protein [Heyndrickxia]APB38058.1 heavy metal-binding protein [Heyndrickxia coagulans]AVD54910.1 copper chaperone [Heyndrickxia coagulans]AWP35790.1 copper chaperone [Heyndrickxia coagulans]MEC2224785.1 heavy-metal-associated domain-containing protein [Weizmannia sp. CD-2023]MED4868266.1 heavy-metal-associated domain-containing protein [Weizmannia sp. CD-2023]
MKKAVMQLETLTCPSCMKKIEGALDKVEGVENVKVLFNASKAKVDFDEGKVSADELKEIVEKTGYQVQAVKTN